MKSRIPSVFAALATCLWAGSASADDFLSPDILILGDSQIPFGSGPAFLDFFTNIHEHCAASPEQSIELEKLGETRVAVIGVRSTSLPSWLARSGPAKGAICDVDKNWRVNAGTYGFINTTGNKYVQIGQGAPYQFCAPGRSAFEEMFRDDYYDPKLTLMTFLGNSARRWAESLEDTVADVERMTSQLPPDMGCIFMTTQPAYKEEIVQLRLRAQENLQKAFEITGSQCSFVPGATEATVEMYQGNANYFRLNSRGRVKDPFHPNEAAARNFFALEMDSICTAIFDQLEDLPPIESETASVQQ